VAGLVRATHPARRGLPVADSQPLSCGERAKAGVRSARRLAADDRERRAIRADRPGRVLREVPWHVECAPTPAGSPAPTLAGDPLARPGSDATPSGSEQSVNNLTRTPGNYLRRLLDR
jgi:hypothetical protein